jgi:ABC-type sugar transport system ATPase subunit
MASILTVKDVWKVYEIGEQRIEALKSVNLEIEKGSFVSIVGHSGSGKTTLLSVVGGLTEPSQGSVLIDGTEVWKLKDAGLSALRNEKIGFIFQFASLIPTLRVIDNVALPVIFNEFTREKGRIFTGGLKRSLRPSGFRRNCSPSPPNCQADSRGGSRLQGPLRTGRRSFSRTSPQETSMRRANQRSWTSFRK